GDPATYEVVTQRLVERRGLERRGDRRATGFRALGGGRCRLGQAVQQRAPFTRELAELVAVGIALTLERGELAAEVDERGDLVAVLARRPVDRRDGHSRTPERLDGCGFVVATLGAQLADEGVAGADEVGGRGGEQRVESGVEVEAVGHPSFLVL